MEYPKNISPELKERLYRELMSILLMVEDRDNSGAIMQLENLINKLQYDKL
jgi:hypothetical protein